MTRNRDSHWICSACACHRPSRFRLADVRRDLAIRFCRAAWNCFQCLPNSPLKRSGLNIQRQRNLIFGLHHLPKRFHFLAQLAISANDFRFGKFGPQLFL